MLSAYYSVTSHELNITVIFVKRNKDNVSLYCFSLSFLFYVLGVFELHDCSLFKRGCFDILKPGPEAIKNSCSTQPKMKFFLLINVKMPIMVGILTFMSRQTSILGLSEPEKANVLYIFILMSN